MAWVDQEDFKVSQTLSVWVCNFIEQPCETTIPPRTELKSYFFLKKRHTFKLCAGWVTSLTRPQRCSSTDFQSGPGRPPCCCSPFGCAVSGTLEGRAGHEDRIPANAPGKKKTITGIFCTVIHFAPVCAPENKVANLIYIANAFIYSTFTRSTLAVHVFCFVFYSFIYSDLLYLVLTGASRQQLVVGLAHSCVSAGQRSGEQRQWTHLQSRIFHPEKKQVKWMSTSKTIPLQPRVE